MIFHKVIKLENPTTFLFFCNKKLFHNFYQEIFFVKFFCFNLYFKADTFLLNNLIIQITKTSNQRNYKKDKKRILVFLIIIY